MQHTIVIIKTSISNKITGHFRKLMFLRLYNYYGLLFTGYAVNIINDD